MKLTYPRISLNLLIFGSLAAGLLLGAVMLQIGLLLNKSTFVGVAALAAIYVLLRMGSGCGTINKEISVRGPTTRGEKSAPQNGKAVSPSWPAAGKPLDPNDINALVEQMLAQGRFALMLRPQLAKNLSAAHFSRALSALEECMALVPDGDVQLEEGELSRVVLVQRFFLDRYPVSNRQFYEFVAGGGYQQANLWDEGILPIVLEFVDGTGHPGPKHWQNGCYPGGEEKHPVIGVNWYEAAAYARWIGKRLPSDAEWVKAGSWPVRISSTSRVQRKYPWGDSMDRAGKPLGFRAGADRAGGSISRRN